jgi:hypothetical protein
MVWKRRKVLFTMPIIERELDMDIVIGLIGQLDYYPDITSGYIK